MIDMQLRIRELEKRLEEVETKLFCLERNTVNSEDVKKIMSSVCFVPRDTYTKMSPEILLSIKKLAMNHSQGEIAKKLNLARSTVGFYIAQLFPDKPKFARLIKTKKDSDA